MERIRRKKHPAVRRRKLRGRMGELLASAGFLLLLCCGGAETGWTAFWTGCGAVALIWAGVLILRKREDGTWQG